MAIKSPDKTRCCMKYRHLDGKFEIKVTDDEKAWTFRTDQRQMVNRINTLNGLLMRIMASPPGEPPDVEQIEGRMKIETDVFRIKREEEMKRQREAAAQNQSGKKKKRKKKR